MRLRDRGVKVLKVDSAKKEFTFRKGLYLISNEAVSLAENKKGLTHVPELVYTEGNPLALSESLNEDEYRKALDSIVFENFLSQTGAFSWAGFDIIGDYIRNPYKIFILVIALIVLLAGLQGL